MAENMPTTGPLDDEELLATAIPIDGIDLDDGEDEPAAARVTGTPTPVVTASANDLAPPRRSQIHNTSERHAIRSEWVRKPNATGAGATHCKTFVAKFRTEAIEHLDQQINEWLDAHPDFEVKLVTTSVGTWQGKHLEDALVVNVWV